MKILSAAQTRELDAFTIEHEPIASIDLMERASHSFVAWFTERYDSRSVIKVFCGIGNNGGDGLAVARMLHQQQYTNLTVYLVYYAEKTSPDCQINLERLRPLMSVKAIRNQSDIPAMHSNEIVIDAVFGSGLTRPAEGIAAQVIDVINASNSTIIAIDIASGLYVDAYNPSPHIVRPTHTVSFQLPKLSFVLPQNAPYVGEWHITDIGLHPEGIQRAETPYQYVDQTLIRRSIQIRSKFSHKGTFGHALLVAGSYGKMGAVVLAAKACLHTGVGLLTLHVPKCGYEIMQIAVPEAMTLTDASTLHFSDAIPNPAKFDAVGIGPGLGTDDATAQALEKLLTKINKPVVLDADALNIVAKEKRRLKLLPPNSILTPHPKEFERLAGETDNEYERLRRLQAFAQENQVVVVLKGAHTAIARPDGQVYFNSTGNPGMATGGTGDALTGIITSLLAQKYAPFEAAMLGVYFHGLAGDKAADQLGYAFLAAGNLIDYLSVAFKEYGM